MYGLTHTMPFQCVVDCKEVAIGVNTVGVQTTQWPVTVMGQVDHIKYRVGCKWTMWGIRPTCPYNWRLYSKRSHAIHYSRKCAWLRMASTLLLFGLQVIQKPSKSIFTHGVGACHLIRCVHAIFDIVPNV